MSNWEFLNHRRVRHGTYGSNPVDGFNGMFQFIMDGHAVKCIASDGEGWQHVSVSLHDKPKMVPPYKIMCQIKQLFWEDEDWVVQFHPAKSEYVNFHKGCLHLWRCLTQPFPTPPSIFVGPKT